MKKSLMVFSLILVLSLSLISAGFFNKKINYVEISSEITGGSVDTGGAESASGSVSDLEIDSINDCINNYNGVAVVRGGETMCKIKDTTGTSYVRIKSVASGGASSVPVGGGVLKGICPDGGTYVGSGNVCSAGGCVKKGLCITASGDGYYYINLKSDGSIDGTSNQVPFDDISDWLNRDNPRGSGDYETLKDFIREGNEVCASDEEVVGIECQTIGGTDLSETGEVAHCRYDLGAVCRNEEQTDGICEDYQVRFLCKKKTQEVSVVIPAVITPTTHECFGTNSYDCSAYSGNYACSSVYPYKNFCKVENGACVPKDCLEMSKSVCESAGCGVVNTTCTDSDGGKNYYVKGKVETENYIQTPFSGGDWCMYINSTSQIPVYSCEGEFCYIQERFCDSENLQSGIGAKNILCPNGCVDGACVGNETQTKSAEIWQVQEQTQSLCLGSSCKLFRRENVEIVFNGEDYKIEMSYLSSSSVVLLVNGRKLSSLSEGEMVILEDANLKINEINSDYVIFTFSLKEECSGCLLANKCFNIGYRTSRKYCSESGEFIELKADGRTCSNSFECESQICIDECVGKGQWEKFLDWFRRIFK